MKTIKTLLFLTMAVFAFVSCGDDDEVTKNANKVAGEYIVRSYGSFQYAQQYAKAIEDKVKITAVGDNLVNIEFEFENYGKVKFENVSVEAADGGYMFSESNSTLYSPVHKRGTLEPTGEIKQYDAILKHLYINGAKDYVVGSISAPALMVGGTVIDFGTDLFELK